jgi:endonuclease/exonuclease/phosphatase (EEP) superfamily protein YafD
MTADGSAVPIMWRTDRFDKITEGRERGLGVRRVEGESRNGTVGPKSIVWVLLRNRATKGLVYVVNTHLLWNVEHGGRPDNKPRRLAAFGDHRDRTIQVADRLAGKGIPVILTMDGNVDQSADAKHRSPKLLYGPLTRAGWKSNHQQLGELRTHGGRSIDYAWSKGAVAVRRQVTGSPHGSDHRQLFVQYSPVTRESVVAA